MLQKETLSFLKDVAENNNREWFAENKQRHDDARADVIQFAGEIVKGLSKIDPLITADTDIKKAVLRIYRDVRFSKNKDPYKKNFGIWFSAKSKGGNEPGYYIHLQPGASFVAGGYWMPEAEHLKAIRQEIDYNADDFKAIVEDKQFAKEFKLGFSNSLKTSPKGYDADDPNIKYLKLKSFEVTKPISDAELTKADAVDKLINCYKSIHPLVAFLRNALNQ